MLQWTLSLGLCFLLVLTSLVSRLFVKESRYSKPETVTFTSNRNWGKSPLPVFTTVEVKHPSYSNYTTFSVYYKANERPHSLWFVDDIPFVGGMGDYFLGNHYEAPMFCMTTIIVPSTVGTRFAVCLQTPDAQNCLTFRPDVLRGFFDQQNEDVDFPWPMFVPAPRARYDSGRSTRIFAPQLDTYDYSYAGQFIYRDPGQADPSRPLSLAEANTSSVDGGGVVSMEPVTSVSGGWILTVATDVRGFEGVLMFRTTIEPPQGASALVERSVSTRPIDIYNRQHVSGPFPANFVAMLPHSGDALPVACRPQSDMFCLLACPFAISGDVASVELSLARVEGASDVHLPMSSLFGQARKTGRYLGEAQFQLNVSDDAQTGLYRCSVTLAGTTSSTLVRLTVV